MQIGKGGALNSEGSICAAPQTNPLINVVFAAASSPKKQTTVGTGSAFLQAYGPIRMFLLQSGK